MGTNYYLKTEPCSHCGRSDEKLHIGKSSGGWCFALHIIPDMGIMGLDDWRKRWETGLIEDEYGDAVTPEQMLDRIANRAGKIADQRDWSNGFGGYTSEAEFHHRNKSQRGPNGLARARIGEYCISHGDGTWDCIVGEFS